MNIDQNTLAAATMEELRAYLPYDLQLVSSSTLNNSMICIRKDPSPGDAWFRRIKSKNTLFVLMGSDRYTVGCAQPGQLSPLGAPLEVLYCDPQGIDRIIEHIYNYFGDTLPCSPPPHRSRWSTS